MCTVLGLRFHPAACGNHKAVSIERTWRRKRRRTRKVKIRSGKCILIDCGLFY